MQVRRSKDWREKYIIEFIPMDAIQSRIMSPSSVVDSMNIWKKRGSFSLAPLQGIAPRINCVSLVTKFMSKSSLSKSMPLASSFGTCQMEKVETGRPG
jgi:hypothetical protein